ncbi:MAG: hypothetical protein ABIQ90_01935 [Polaromonas sp.]|uniref:hypothetical protein n=1 Tax=Polaromonas sp. TaxID=1869339 RepID=UPI0013B71165|nr:hypothetical protein [Polaromonas sp.]NDP61403.1 hypothetical protein [Polaromonas sp.]
MHVKSFGQERVGDEKLRQKRALRNNDGSLIFQEKTGLCVSGFRLAASVIPGNQLLHAMSPPKLEAGALCENIGKKQKLPGAGPSVVAGRSNGKACQAQDRRANKHMHAANIVQPGKRIWTRLACSCFSGRWQTERLDWITSN